MNLRGFKVPHSQVDQFSVRPLASTAAQQQYELHRTQNMLVVTIIGAMIIVVVAALFMTMF